MKVNNLAKINFSGAHAINSKTLSEYSGYKRCVLFDFYGWDADGIPLFTLYMQDDEFFLNNKKRKNLILEITDHILENRKTYEL